MNQYLEKTNIKRGFSLVELLVVVLILGCILILAVNHYREYIDTARFAKARQDIDEIIKAIRLHNINENERFTVEVLSPRNLGPFIGTYLDFNSAVSLAPAEKEGDRNIWYEKKEGVASGTLGGYQNEGNALLDPWGHYYRHSPNLGIVYSLGPNGEDETITSTLEFKKKDDIVVYYLPNNLFILKAEFVDANQDNQIGFNDYIELTFSKPAIVENAIGQDFETANPEKALGTVSIKSDEKNPSKARITLIPPIASNIVIGKTTILPREYIDSIHDYSPNPIRLQRFDSLKITKRKK